MSNLDTVDRVRANSSARMNWEIDREIRKRVAQYDAGDSAGIAMRLDELEREWDIERVIEANASTLALAGLGLAVTRDKRWLFLTGTVLAFLLQHSVQGWCPPVPVLRRMGVRTRREIDVEVHALKALRGDFAEVTDGVTAELAARQ